MNIISVSHSGKGNHARFTVDFADDPESYLRGMFAFLAIPQMPHASVQQSTRGASVAWNKGDFYAALVGNRLTMFVHPTKTYILMTPEEHQQYEMSLDACNQLYAHFYALFLRGGADGNLKR